MQTIPNTKIKLPVAKVFAFISKLVVSCKGGISHDEAAVLLSDFLELFAVVLTENVSK